MDRQRQVLTGDLGLLGRALKDKSLTFNDHWHLCDNWLEAFLRIDKDRQAAFDAVWPTVDQARPGSSLAYTLRGKFLKDYAWDARTSKPADQVSEPQWKLFKERLSQAEQAFQRAWELDPKNPVAPATMIIVARGTSMPRAQMEEWFQRAVRADHNYLAAYEAKAHYLQPRWCGSEKDVLAFGRECLATKNWKARVPFVLIQQGHIHLAGLPRNAAGDITGLWKENRLEYWKQPDVWPDVQAVYEGMLKEFPNNTFDRSMYAKLACWCEQWAVADRQFKLLGDRVSDIGVQVPQRV